MLPFLSKYLHEKIKETDALLSEILVIKEFYSLIGREHFDL